MQSAKSLSDRISNGFERFVILAVQALLAVVILLALLNLWGFLFSWIANEEWRNLSTVPDLQRRLQGALAGVLLVVLALELREALRNYFVEHRVRVEVILSLALIAAGRHIIQMDFEHVPGFTLIGIAALMTPLIIGLYFIRRDSHGK